MKVMSSLAVKTAYLELVPQFEKSSGKRVDTEWVGMVDIRKRVGAGETIDAVIGSAALVDELVARGEYELAFQQVSELMAVEGIRFVGPLPAEVQTITVFSGGVHAAAQDAEGARALFAFLKAREAHAVLRRKGLEPA